MKELSYILGVLCKVIFECLLFGVLLRVISDIFLKKDNPFRRFLFFVTESALVPMRLALSKSPILSRIPVDAVLSVSCIILAALCVLFGIWF